MSDGTTTGWRRAMLSMHGLAAVLPLLCLVTIILRAASVGFAADRELYTRIENDPENIVPFMLQAWREPRGRVIAALGLGDRTPTKDSQAVVILRMLSEAGVQVRVVSDHPEANVVLSEGIVLMDNVEEAVSGANSVLLVGEGDRFESPDYLDFRSRMQGQLIFDLTARADGIAIDVAGLQLLPFGAPLGPPWLDPELLAYAAHLREKIPAGDGVLLIINERPSTLSGRARWFLHLNNLVFPRRLYLENSFGASGTSVQFRQWVLDQRERGGFSGRGQRRWEPSPRDFSQVTQVGPVRTLNDAERAAVASNDVQWVTFFTMNTDFRLQDWETMTAKEALAGP
ncbi:MAG: UDP binding domain-containing protein [Planctomycetes bacterium]|nr:UDP binding domain-containing protein [Planctomycetota bacterium]